LELPNHQHNYSQLNFVSPAERHVGLDGTMLQQCKQILEEARRVNPNRWSGSVRNCEPIGSVMLSPDRELNMSLKTGE